MDLGLCLHLCSSDNDYQIIKQTPHTDRRAPRSTSDPPFFWCLFYSWYRSFCLFVAQSSWTCPGTNNSDCCGMGPKGNATQRHNLHPSPRMFSCSLLSGPSNEHSTGQLSPLCVQKRSDINVSTLSQRVGGAREGAFSKPVSPRPHKQPGKQPS